MQEYLRTRLQHMQFSRFLFALQLLLLSLFFTSCSRPCCDYPVMGADEFVTDSYKIRGGKLSILEMQGICLEEVSDEDFDEYVDYITEDDILNIMIYHPSRKDLMSSFQTINGAMGFRVRNGMINTPDLPPVCVAGLTLDQAKERLEAKFREQIQDIEVFINYRDRLSRKVDLTGMTGVPYIPVDGKVRLYDIMSLAHVPSTANLFMSYVLRDGKHLAVDLYRLMNEGDMDQNIVMYGGDKVFIASPTDSQVMIMGEVFRPRPVAVPYGFVSLRLALVEAGGIPFTGNYRNIQVIRGNLVNPKIYVLSWDHIVNLPNDSLLLIPGDTVYVSEKPITQWNRFISQLLPSFSGLQTGYAAYSLMR